MVNQVTDGDFKREVLESEGPVLVDFWAEWCGPCRQIAPMISEIAEEKSGALKVVKLNISDNPDTPSQFGVRGIPTLMVFKGGKVVSTRVGALPKSSLYEWIDEVLK